IEEPREIFLEPQAAVVPASVAVPAVPKEEPRRAEAVPIVVDARPPDRHSGPYRLPDLAIFDVPPSQAVDDSNRAHVLEDTLASFGVGAKVSHIERGPSITRYELRPERGVKISRISSLADDLALALAATSVRIEAPIPGKSAVGIEIPNLTVSVVSIREILDAVPNRGQVPPLWMALGKDITGRPVFGDLCKMPHLLVAGATGAGKSVCLNMIIASLLVCATPDQVQMLMIDPKRVELTVFNGIPHLIKDVIADPRLAAGALFEMTKEMEARYERFAKASVRKIEEYNVKYPDERLPYVVIVIDELADLMLVAPARVETTIMRLAQLGRATGIHLVVATQRPSVDVITGLIKANVPSRIAFAVSSQADSRVILDMNGAERLLGRGDMLYLPIDAPKPIRAQGALITNAEVSRLVEFWARQGRPDNLLDVEVVPVDDEIGRRDTDPLCYEAAKFIIESNYASTAALQSQFSIGHPRAVRVMKQLEEFKVVGQHEGTKPRKIIVGLPELELMATRLGKDQSPQQDLFASGE
ncbi:MAG TPA: DNA translocase FtsK, partial [Candidatus Cybelea sp.]|nr:DNA translocase FtsK [Candidatus Cybelea sp.]